MFKEPDPPFWLIRHKLKAVQCLPWDVELFNLFLMSQPDAAIGPMLTQSLRLLFPMAQRQLLPSAVRLSAGRRVT